MSKICFSINKWVTENVTEPVENWISQQEKKCKQYPWYDPRGWFCWFVTILVKVITWVTRTIVSKITYIICVFISWIVDMVLGWIPFIHTYFKVCHFKFKEKKELPNGEFEYTFYCKCKKNCDDKTEVTVVASNEKTAIDLAKKECNDRCKKVK